MSHPVAEANEAEHHSASHLHQVAPHQPQHHNRIAQYAARFLKKSDSLIYAIVGICFFLGGLFALGYSFWDLGSTMTDINHSLAHAVAAHTPTTPQAIVAGAIIKLVSDLLPVLIFKFFCWSISLSCASSIAVS